MASFCDQPLISFAARSLEAANCDDLAVVTGYQEVAAHLPHFKHIAPKQKNASQAHSLIEALCFASKIGSQRAVIVLGDMPFIPSDHLSRLAARCNKDLASASTDGNRVMVPACFPQSWFHRLRQITGDAGARAFLQDLPAQQRIQIAPDDLLDIDYVADLRQAEHRRAGH